MPTTPTNLTPAATNFIITTRGVGLTNDTKMVCNYSLQYSTSTSGPWTVWDNYVDDVQVTNTTGWSDPNETGTTKKVPDDNSTEYYHPIRTIHVSLPLGSYTFRIVNDGEILTVSAEVVATPGTPTSTGGTGGGSISGSSGSYPPKTGTSAGTTTVTYTGQTSKTMRRTYDSPVLPRGRYSIRVRKTNTPVDEKHIQDTYLQDVSEIQNSKVSLATIATGWFSIKMSDQISGIPNITWPIKGVKCDIYDKSGNVTSTAWSANPADIVLDMLIGKRRGALRDKISIDFPAYVEWRDYCTTNGLMFNGVFDEMGTLWDAVGQVFKVGRAYPVRVGSKLSVAVDKPSTPVMLFGPGNIFKDTFQISYLPLQDRANEFEVSYYDKDDQNKKKTIRIADPTAAQAGEIPKTAQYDLFGIDNFTQAQKEVWYQLYQNRLSRRVITFDAPVESIGLSLGDVAYIQHDMVEWGQAGRLLAGLTTTSVTLDKQVTIESGKTYSLLVTHSKVLKTTCNIGSHTGTTFNLSGLSTGLNSATLKRIVTNVGDEAAILSYTSTGGTTATVVLDRVITGSTASIYDVDVIEERTVNSAVGTRDTITVSSAFSQVPDKYANYMFGEASTVKRPYRLNSIKGNGVDRRTLTFAEYDERVYAGPEHIIPAPGKKAPKTPTHVKGLRFSTDLASEGDTMVHGIVSWTSGNVYRYGGADVYVGRGEVGDFIFYKTVLNTNACELDVGLDEKLRIKVVAFNDAGIRANINTAPVVGYNVKVAQNSIETPGNGAAIVERTVDRGDVRITWDSDTRVSQWIVQVQLQGETTRRTVGFTRENSFVIQNIPFGNHTAYVQSWRGIRQQSDWLAVPFSLMPNSLPDPTDFGISHTLNKDGSANVVLTWNWTGDQGAFDGFEVLVHQSDTADPGYVIHATPESETAVLVNRNTRAYQFHGIPADKFYTFWVRAFQQVDRSADETGIWVNTSTAPAFAAYQPSSSVTFMGDIQGTVGGTPVSQLIAGIESTLDDQVISTQEKKAVLLPDVGKFHRDYTQKHARANSLGLDLTALDAAKTLWENTLNAMYPKYNDLTQNTKIYDPLFGDTKLTDWTPISSISTVLTDGYYLVGSGSVERVNSAIWLDFKNKVYAVNGADVASLSSMDGYSYSRSGTVLYPTSVGTVTSFAANVASVVSNIGYQAQSGTTNLELRSQTFDLRTQNQVTTTSNAATAPDGTTTADKITCSITGNNGSVIDDAVGATVSGSTYTTSVYFKAGTSRYGYIQLNTAGNAQCSFMAFDLLTGTVGTSTDLLGTLPLTGYIVPLANGWYRCSVVWTAVSTAINGIYIGMSDTITSRSATAGTDIYVWQSQTILGNWHDGGPIIPSTTTTAAIGADVLSATINPITTDEDFVLWGTATFAQGTYQAVIAEIGSTGLCIGRNTSGNIMLNVPSVTQYTGASASAGGKHSILMRRRSGRWTLAYKLPDGSVTIGTEGSITSFPSTSTTLQVGQDGGDDQPNGVIEGVFMKRGSFTDTQLTEILNNA